jgi:hypothetical protein
MTTVIFIIVLLAFLAGLIAYTGDILGTVIGKRRLSLFGVRPKQTGRLVGVLAGILIMLTTIGVLGLTLRNATRQFFAAQELNQQVSQLKASQNALQRELESSRRLLEQQEARLGEIQARAEELGASNQELSTLNESLGKLNTELVAKTESATTDFLVQQEYALSLRTQLDDRAQQLRNLQDQIKAIEENGQTYAKNQIIHSAIIAAQDESSVREALRQFINEARDKAVLRGANGLKDLSPDDIQVLIEEIIATPESDILTFSSPSIQFQASEVVYSKELVPNNKIAERGQLVTSQQIHLGSSQNPISREEISAQLARLSTAARSSLYRLNLTSGATLEASGLSADAFAEQLSRLKGPVTIGMTAHDDVFAAGPASLEFEIIY